MADKLMYTNKDIELIKATFAENEELLKVIRKLFFGYDLSEEEKDLIKSSFSNKEVIEVLRRKVYGLNNINTPIGQLSDFWLGVEQQIFGASRDTIFQAIESKKMVLNMFTKAFNLLENPDGEKVSVDTNPMTETDPLGVLVIARNLYMKAIETALLTIQTIAGKKSETVEETVARLQKDSNK